MHRQKGRIQEAIIVVGRKIMSWPVESHRRPTLVEVALCGNTETRGSTIFYMLLEWLGARFRASSDFEMLNNLKPSNDRDSTSEMPNVV